MDTVVTPVDPSTLDPPAPAPGSLVAAATADPTALVYFLVNVGDGDTQLVLLPPDSKDGARRLVIVDVATAGKLPELVASLHEAGLLTEAPGTAGQIRLLVATHPHMDHIGGMADLLKTYNRPADGGQGCIDQFWEPGYFFTSPTFHTMMRQLEASPWIRRLQPTAGTTCYLDSLKITVLGPGVGLRTRFDTYGVEINDSSITLMLEYPATRVYTEPDPVDPGRRNRRSVRDESRRLLLGGDAQFTSWAQATTDFPDMKQQDPVLAKELRTAVGRDYLAADVFKMSHHGSKHGITLELMERVGAEYVLASCTVGGGKYHFPHALAMDAAREARQATTSNGAPRRSDHDLGIHVTGAQLSDAAASPLGSLALLVPRSSRAPIRLFRMMDRPESPIDLAQAREVTAAGGDGAAGGAGDVVHSQAGQVAQGAPAG